MNPNASSTKFHAVEHDVVRFGARLGEFAGIDQGNVFGFRSGKRMMHRVPLVLRGVESHERKISHPKKIEHFRAFGKFLVFGDAQS